MPRNLLLADDSITIQKVVGITFAGEDFTIVAVDNGEDAIRRARESHPDIVLADVVMPKKNGYEVCEAVKNDPELAHIPVLLLAGTFEAFDEARARAVRADGHIAKPFESQALVSKVRELLEHRAAAANVGGKRPHVPVTSTPATNASVIPPRTIVPPVLSRPSPPLVSPPATVPRESSPRSERTPEAERGSAGELDWAALGFEAAPASAPTPPPAPAVTAPETTPELLPFGEPIDLADLEVEEGEPEPEFEAVSEPPTGARPQEPSGVRTVEGVPSADGGEALLRTALSHASREVIERIAWEVIPNLAETIIREHVERLVRAREKQAG